jgi:hypothetical protein
MENIGIFLSIWNSLRKLGIFYLLHLLQFVVIWYIFPRFGMLRRANSGNPGRATQTRDSFDPTIDRQR